jgi:hypothetical protein
VFVRRRHDWGVAAAQARIKQVEIILTPRLLVTLGLPKEEIHLCSGVFFFGVTSDVPEHEVLPRHKERCIVAFGRSA